MSKIAVGRPNSRGTYFSLGVTEILGKANRGGGIFSIGNPSKRKGGGCVCSAKLERERRSGVRYESRLKTLL